MAWELAGKHVYEVDDALATHDSSQTGKLSGLPAEIEDESYLVRGFHLVPYFPPAPNASDQQRTRERLNIELCDRVFRISDARDVTRLAEAADEAINTLMYQYEISSEAHRRGLGRVLFGRIVSRIRDLSRVYLELCRDNGTSAASEAEKQMLGRIHDLYQYVMVERRDIFDCVRLYDQSIDRDGIIEEVFSEIGKTQQLPIETIYNNRVIKIGEAMASIEEVADTMTTVLSALTTLPLEDLRHCLREYSAMARRVVGIPTSDTLAYDEVAAEYILTHDAMREAVVCLDELNPYRTDLHHLIDWLRDGVNLIHSMQNIRDGRANSIAAYQKAAGRWTDMDIPKLVKVS